jgi:hypothetical protein
MGVNMFHIIPQSSTREIFCFFTCVVTDDRANYLLMDSKDRVLKLKEAAEAEVQRLEAELRVGKAKAAAFEESLAALGINGEAGAVASVLRRVQEKTKKEQAGINELASAIIDAKGRVAGFDEVLKLFPKDGEDAELRADSQMYRVREVLRKNGRPMNLTEILKELGFEGDEKKRNSLRGSLASYARDGRVFDRGEGTETFGLLEFPCESESKG